MPRPFEQIPFDVLPEQPRVPHADADTDRHRIDVTTEHFGTVPTAYRTFGDGPPLLLVHGLMTTGYSWRYVLESLGAQFRLIIPDLPGSGDTGKPDTTYGPEDTADWIGAFIRRVGIEGCAAIGNSMGGYLCMWLALRQPRALSRLVNLHSPGVPLARLYALRAALSLPGSGTILRALVHRDAERWVHRNVHYYDETLKSREEARTYAAPLLSEVGVRAFAAILRDTVAPIPMRRMMRELAARRRRGEAFPVPLQLVYASRDPMVPPHVGHTLRRQIPGSQFVEMDEASHFAHVDAPERFVSIALPFLTGV